MIAGTGTVLCGCCSAAAGEGAAPGATILSIFASVLAALSGSASAYPPFVGKAKKFGAKDCTFCHVDPMGGPPWNERGKWLIKEKERRKADAVNVEWLAEYKEGKDGGAQVKPAEPS